MVSKHSLTNLLQNSSILQMVGESIDTTVKPSEISLRSRRSARSAVTTTLLKTAKKAENGKINIVLSQIQSESRSIPVQETAKMTHHVNEDAKAMDRVQWIQALSCIDLRATSALRAASSRARWVSGSKPAARTRPRIPERTEQ